MNMILFSIGFVLVATTFAISAYADHQMGHWDGVKPCKTWCFDPVINWGTRGYDRDFLAQPSVKQTCQEALADGVRLGYCDTTLGTL
jgi:hypothetical protein